MTALPQDYAWLASESGPKMIVEAVKLYGTLEMPGEGDNPTIMAWADETGLDHQGYTHDEVPWCFGAFTMVATPGALTPISKVETGQFVFGLDGALHEVGATMDRLRDTVELRALGVPETLTTDDHPFLARRRSNTYAKGQRRRVVADPQWIKAGELRRGDFIAIPPCPEEGDGGPDDAVAHLLGIYVAEGTGRATARYHGKPTAMRPASVSLHVAHKERDILALACRQAGLEHCTFTERRTCTQVEIRDQWFVALCGPFGRIALEKTIPHDALLWRTSARRALLDGYVFGDGHFVESLGRTDCSTISLSLAVSLAALARSLGHKPSIRVEHRAGTQVIEGRDVTIRDRYIVKWFSWKSDVDTYPREQSFTDGGFTWVPVRSVKPREKREIVYDLTVDGSAFIANGAVVHNCGLFMAVVAQRAGKNLPSTPLRALSWGEFGTVAPVPALGDVLVFKRTGGGHVALYVGEDDTAFHCLGGNQGDAVSIVRKEKARVFAVRRPLYHLQPSNVRAIHLAPTGALSTAEA